MNPENETCTNGKSSESESLEVFHLKREITTLKDCIAELESIFDELENEYENRNISCGDRASLIGELDKLITKALTRKEES